MFILVSIDIISFHIQGILQILRATIVNDVFGEQIPLLMRRKHVVELFSCFIWEQWEENINGC